MCEVGGEFPALVCVNEEMEGPESEAGLASVPGIRFCESGTPG